MEDRRTFEPKHKVQETPVDLMEVFHSLDDDTLRRVFGMGTLTESQLRDVAEKADVDANSYAEDADASSDAEKANGDTN
jgi:hypothetical protein